VREGAAKALGALAAHHAALVEVGAAGPAAARAAISPDDAVTALLGVAAGDTNLDVRRAAVRSLAGWTGRDDVTAALRRAATDPDADVRAYARRALDARGE
jgi:hypothetical protein